MSEETQDKQTPPAFAAAKDVLGYLQATRQINKSKLYKDIRDGYLRKQKDGSFRQIDVDRYAASLKPLALDPRVMDDLSDLARKEQEERVLKLVEQRKTIAFDRALKEGRYILRDEVALELAARAIALSIGLRSALAVAAPELIASVHGNADMADALTTVLETHLDAALHEFSRPMEFDVEAVDAGLADHDGESHDD